MIAELASRTKVPFRVADKPVAAFGLPADPPITFRASGLSLRNVLTYMLPELELDWTVEKGAILITAHEDMDNHMLTVDYAVGDLMEGRVLGSPP